MFTLLWNISQSSIPDPFIFLDYSVTFLCRLSFPFTETILYHFDPIASWSFEPPLIYLNTIISKRAFETNWNIGVMSIDDMFARGFVIERGHELDTIERRRDALVKFKDRQWKYVSFGPPDYFE